MGPSNSMVGATVESRSFQHRFGLSILAIQENTKNVLRSDLPSHVLAVGDTILAIGPGNILRHLKQSTGVFLYVDCLDPSEGSSLVDSYVFRLPVYFPFGQLRDGGSKRGPYKMLMLPSWWGYLGGIVFLGVVTAAAVGPELLSTYALYATALFCLLGIMEPEYVLRKVNLQLLLILTFSFPLGSAVSKSGLAGFVGYSIANAGIRGFPLHLLIGVLSVITTLLITGRAATQVLFTIVVAIYKKSGEDPIPGIIVVMVCVNLGICTVYGLPTNLIVAGPGKYSAGDFARFGTPITIVTVLMTALLASAVYEKW
jgi:di/tricarboxylate transporter